MMFPRWCLLRPMYTYSPSPNFRMISSGSNMIMGSQRMGGCFYWTQSYKVMMLIFAVEPVNNVVLMVNLLLIGMVRKMMMMPMMLMVSLSMMVRAGYKMLLFWLGLHFRIISSKGGFTFFIIIKIIYRTKGQTASSWSSWSSSSSFSSQSPIFLSFSWPE